jgi:hypothetical protein
MKNLNPSIAGDSKITLALKKIITHDLFWILIISGIARIFFYSNYFDSVNADSPSYLNYLPNVFWGEVDAFRTPLYPYFIKLVRFFVNPQFIIHKVVIIQSLISFSTIIFFYNIVKTTFQKRPVIIAATLLYAMSPSIINYDKCILTESLSLSFIVIFLSMIINYLKKPTILKASAYTVSTFFAVMLRPSFIIMVPIMLLFWVLRLFFFKAERKINISGIAASLACILLIAGYTHLNYKENDCNGISGIKNLNQLDLIIKYDMYEKGNDKEITETIRKNISNTYGQEVYWKMQCLLLANYPQSRIATFVNSCILNQPKIYIQKTFMRVYKISNEQIATQYATRKDGFAGLFNFILNINFITFTAIYLLILLDFIYIVYQWARTKKIHWFKILLWAVMTGQLAVAIIGAQTQYQRLFVIAMPCIILISFSYIDILFYSISKSKIADYQGLNKY